MTKIRRLSVDDEAGWRKLWAGYLEFYKNSDLPEAVTANSFNRFLDNDDWFAFVAVEDTQLVGFVHALLHPSTWSENDVCYLEDLFVAQSVRGGGVGRALIEKVFEEARSRNCHRVYWITEESNKQARILYDDLATLTGFVHYRREL